MRVTLFAWSTTLRKILTKNNLRKWHVLVVDWCCMCKRSREFVDHLLLITMALRMLSLAALGYVKTIGRPFCLFERDVWQSSDCSSVEDCFILPNVVSLEETK
jgi:hypothetical protein